MRSLQLSCRRRELCWKASSLLLERWHWYLLKWTLWWWWWIIEGLGWFQISCLLWWRWFDWLRYCWCWDLQGWRYPSQGLFRVFRGHCSTPITALLNWQPCLRRLAFSDHVRLLDLLRWWDIHCGGCLSPRRLLLEEGWVIVRGHRDTFTKGSWPCRLAQRLRFIQFRGKSRIHIIGGLASPYVDPYGIAAKDLRRAHFCERPFTLSMRRLRPLCLVNDMIRSCPLRVRGTYDLVVCRIL